MTEATFKPIKYKIALHLGDDQYDREVDGYEVTVIDKCGSEQRLGIRKNNDGLWVVDHLGTGFAVTRNEFGTRDLAFSFIAKIAAKLDFSAAISRSKAKVIND